MNIYLHAHWLVRKTPWRHKCAAVSKTLWKSSFSPEKKVLVCTKGISSRFRVGIYERDPKQLLDGDSLINGENTVVKTFGNHGEITPLQYIMHVSIVTRYYAHIKFSKRNVSAHWEHVRVQSCLWIFINSLIGSCALPRDVINERQLLKPVLKKHFFPINKESFALSEFCHVFVYKIKGDIDP